MLGTLVEEVSGQALEEFLSERIFVPLGMSDTFYTVPAPKAGRVVTVHRTTADGLVEAPNPAEITAPAVRRRRLALDGRRLREIHPAVPEQRPRAERHAALERSDGRAHAARTTSAPFSSSSSRPRCPRSASRFRSAPAATSSASGFQITGPHTEPFARSPGSMSWAGIFNTEFWIDPARGIGGVLLMQYLPFYDAAAIETLQGFERRVYEGLAD